nr:PREDICTED: glutamate receptor 2.2-like [Daucus carota subsp. sativus]
MLINLKICHINAARDLLSTHGVKAILGGHAWNEALAIAEVTNEEALDVTVFLSFADSSPSTPTFPWFIQATPSQQVQVNAIAAITESWGLHRVTLIYENIPTISSPELIVSQLSQALQKTGGELSYILTLNSISLNSIPKELIQLKKQKNRVFVIHSTLESCCRLYQNAKLMNMTGDGYAWIATNSITDQFHAIGPKKMSFTASNSIDVLKDILWPAQPWHTERRRRFLAGTSGTIRVGVPAKSLFRQFVKVETHPKTNVVSYDGFSIKVYEEALKIAYVDTDLTFNYTPFEGEYDDLVEQIALGRFDAVAGDVTILEKRHRYADFSQPYTESGMVLIVPIRSRLPSRLWLFLKPFTKEMWGLIVVITIYNGFTVWLIERKYTPEFRSGSVSNQIGTFFWLAFTTLFTLRGDRLHSNLSRIAMVVWLFVALIITQSYTASLASMLTAQRLEPAIKDVATLKKMNATVGYCRGSFLKLYMINALGFNSANINKYPSTAEYAKALNSKEIAGIFLEVPSAKVFLAQYCKSFIKTEKTFKDGGYGFAFEKEFPRLPDINKAIMNITESGKLLELENKYINSEECVDADSIPEEDASIGLNSFSILFALTGCTSTIALGVYVVRYFLISLPKQRILFRAFAKRWRHYRRQLSARVISVENPRNPPDDPYWEARHSFSTVSDIESLEDNLEP